MEVKLKGAESKLNIFLKKESLWMKRNKIEVIKKEVIELEEEEELIEPEAIKVVASKVAELIAECESLEDLKQYESDDRQVVKSAYKKKLKELE